MSNDNWSDRNGWFLDIVRNYVIICTLEELGLLWIWRPIVFLIAVVVATFGLLLPWKIGIFLLVFSSLLFTLPFIRSKRSKWVKTERRRLEKIEDDLDKEAVEVFADFEARVAEVAPTHEEEYKRQRAYMKEREEKRLEERRQRKNREEPA